MRKFKELLIWKESINLVKEVYEIANYLPDTERFGLKSQIQRAAISIPSNIAEGCSRTSNIEFSRFLEISLGSAYELETQIILIQILKLISEDLTLYEYINQINNIQKMISRFRASLRNKNT